MPFDFYRTQNIFDPRKMQPPASPDMGPYNQYNIPDKLNPNAFQLGDTPGGYPEGFGPTPPAPPLFDSRMPQQPQMSQGPQEVNEQQAYQDQINKIMQSYSPETRFSDELYELTNNMPQRDQNISKPRKFGGFLVGLAQGPEAQDKALYAPYHRQLADWKTKLGPTLQGAQQERYANQNERQLLYNTAQATSAARQQTTREEAEDRRLAKSKADIERDQEKNRINNWKANNPKGEVIYSSDGFVHLVDPLTGEDTKTTVEHRYMTDLEKARWRRGDIIEQGNQRRLTYKEREADPNKGSNIVVRDFYDNENNVIGSYDYNKVTKQYTLIPLGSEVPEGAVGPTGSFRSKPGESQTQREQGVSNKIQQWLLRNPKDADWFEQDQSTGMWKIVEPGKLLGRYPTGPPPDRYRQMQSFIGQQGAAATPSNVGRTSQGNRYTVRRK
jgi:hypothetical protein